MLMLPKGCHISGIKVHPKNWLQIGASCKIDWYVHYRFYDPQHPKPKLRVIKGMNDWKTIVERRMQTKIIIEKELQLLIDYGFNPITGHHQELNCYEVNPDTLFVPALKYALTKVYGVKGTLVDMGCVIRGVEKAIKQLHFIDLRVGEASRKYIKQILEQCGKNNKRFSAHRYNKYRAYLMRLFKELVEMEACDINPIRDIQKMKETVKERIMLSDQEKSLINKTLFKDHYKFWRAIQIFYHSGSRETELMRVQVKHVDLKKQECKYLVKKGVSVREVTRPIKDQVLNLWEELIQNANPEDFIFSKNLVPGSLPIRPDQFGRRWNLHVKNKLKIKAGLYSLKHLNTTETMDELSRMYNYDPAVDVARMNGHTNTAMVINIYDKNNVKRQNDRLKKVGNKFE